MSLVWRGDLNVTNWASKVKNQKPLLKCLFCEIHDRNKRLSSSWREMFLFLQVTAERLAGTDQRDDDDHISKT